MSSRRNSSIDLFKFIFSIFVIAIHTALFSDVNNALYFYFVHILCRVAVPFFAICTGYFISQKKEKKSHFAQWEKMSKLYVVWSIVYLLFAIPMWKQTGWFGLNAFIDYVITMFIKGSHYHLWYLLSIIVALPIFCIILEKVNEKRYKTIAIGLYMIKALVYGYAFVITKYCSVLIVAFDKISAIMDAMFCILPMLILGTVIKNEDQYQEKYLVVKMIMSIFAWGVEAIVLKNVGVTGYSFLIFTLPTSYYLFKVIKNIKWNKKSNFCKLLGEISMYIYCVHPLLIESLQVYKLNSISLFIIVVFMSLIISVLLVVGKNRLFKKKNRGEICFS